jgi:CBS domain-containing protein
MRTVRDIMEPAVTVGPDVPVHELADRLVDAGADGAVVVDGGRIVGVATSMDLVARLKTLHPPSVLRLLDLVLPLPATHADEADRRRVAATTAGKLMSPDPHLLGPGALASEAATLMVEQHLSLLPVVDGGALIGVVSRRSILRAIAAHR